jgi:acetyl/propionyl-CoA carboxylase alpha subunit
MRTVFVANRAEIAHRVIRTARSLGYRTAAACSPADRSLPYAREADVLVEWEGDSSVGATYLDADKVLEAARRAGAHLLHPGYGFLSENVTFAEKVLAAGLVWIGPPPDAIRAMGDKASARAVAVQHDVPVVPGFQESQDPEVLLQQAAQIGYPVLIKAVAGGGGRGMRRVDAPEAFLDALASARREAVNAFGNGEVLLERYVTRPRHVEVQIMADQHGNVLFLGERECSVQRRHQKIVEEAPSPAVDEALRQRMGEAAVRVARATGYVGAGTVEFILDESGAFYFLEMNTRLQVEHPVTEQITGLDLVALQLHVAEGLPLPLRQENVVLRGHAIEVRVYAEDPLRGYLPATGLLHRVHLEPADGLRYDVGFASGNEVSPYYDAMLAKLVAHGPDRRTATRRLLRATQRAWIPGVVTNLPLLRELLAHTLWEEADLDTAFLERAGLPTPPPLNLELGVLGALALGQLERGTRAPGPAGWRVFGRATQHERFRSGTSEVAVRWTPTAGGFVAELPSGTHTVRLLGRQGDEVTLSVDGLRSTWRILRVPASPTHSSLDDGDLVYVHTGSAEAFVQLEPRFPARAGAELEPGQCVAPTPGKVVAVYVSVGDVVTAGQRLLTLEAMKMEHAVTAPASGVVVALHVAVGEAVAEGATLARVEAQPEEP